MHQAAPPHPSRNGSSPEAGFFAPRLGAEGEPCAACGAALAADQRYCLHCGTRRAGTRVPFPAAVAPVVPVPVPEPVAAPVVRRSLSVPVWSGLAGVAAVSLGILAGVVLMNARGDESAGAAALATMTPAATSVATAAAAVVASVTPDPASVVFTPDWAAGTDGWTVQLQTLPKDGTTPDAVATAKADATAAGAAEVGALDSDEFASLEAGQYVIYSTVSSSKTDAQAVLDGIQANFPDAKLIEVSTTAPAETKETPAKPSDSELKKKEKTQTPEEAQKNMRNAPEKTETQGDKVKPDDKAAGGGSETEEF